MKIITNEVIHDGGSSSTELNQQLKLTIKEFERKREILNKVGSLGKLKGRFKTLSFSKGKNRDNANRQNLNLEVYTADNAALRLSLSRYHNSCYFSTSGSPARVLTGQNVTSEVRDQRLIQNLVKELKCSEFEAGIVAGFKLVQEMIKENLGETFFTVAEMSEIDKRNLRVFNVGYATYLDFGIDRDQVFHHLITLSEYRIYRNDRSIPLLRLIGNGISGISHDSLENASGFFGRRTSVTLKKSSPAKALYLSQTLYLKDVEVEEKNAKEKERFGTSHSTKNALTVSVLNNSNTDLLKNRLVRIDSTFYQLSLREWAKAFGLKEVENQGTDFTVRRLAPIFADDKFVRSMALRSTFELGIFHLLLGPSPKSLFSLKDNKEFWAQRSSADREIFISWLDAKIAIVDHPGHGVQVDYKSVLGTNDTNLRRFLWKEKFIDLAVPFLFYAEAFKAKMELAATWEEGEALTMAFTGAANRKSWKEIEEISAGLRTKVAKSIISMRKSLSLASAIKGKKQMIRELT